MEGDQSIWFTSFFSPQFQSTPSAWRETAGFVDLFQPFFISIHSLRMEGDYIDLVDGDPAIIISIHSLRMEGDFFGCSPPR